MSKPLEETCDPRCTKDCHDCPLIWRQVLEEMEREG